MGLTLSRYQIDILNWQDANIGTGNNLVVSAGAGTGKTFTAKQLFKQARSKEQSCIYLAFNREIRDAVAPSLPRGVACMTYHSHGYQAVKDAFGGAQLNQNKVIDFLKDEPQLKYIKYKIAKIVSLCKSGGIVGPDDKTLVQIAFDRDIAFEDREGRPQIKQMELAFEWVRRSIQYSIDNPVTVDFDDMLFIPWALTLPMRQYDLVVIDELQDTNYIQMELAKWSSVAEYGNIIGIGDRHQAIYAFRGAGAESVDEFIAGTAAGELPLSLSYRCPKAVGRLVNKKFPYIPFEVLPDAPEGVVADMPETAALRNMQQGDLVLCRVNADLVQAAFDLLRMGKPAIIKGRDIGKGLVSKIKQSEAYTTKEFIVWLEEWRKREVEKAIVLENEARLQNITDTFETLKIIAEGTSFTAEIEARCSKLFDDRTGRCIVLSTVHRAKGLEAERVFILRPDLMPHPAAQKPVDVEQERNIEYVAITRTKNELYFVRGTEKELPEQKQLPEPVLSLKSGIKKIEME